MDNEDWMCWNCGEEPGRPCRLCLRPLCENCSIGKQIIVGVAGTDGDMIMDIECDPDEFCSARSEKPTDKS